MGSRNVFSTWSQASYDSVKSCAEKPPSGDNSVFVLLSTRHPGPALPIGAIAIKHPSLLGTTDLRMRAFVQ